MNDKTAREEQLEHAVMTLGNALFSVLCLDTGGHDCGEDGCPLIPCDDLRNRVKYGMGLVASLPELLTDPVGFGGIPDFEVRFRANQMLGDEQMQQTIRAISTEVQRVTRDGVDPDPPQRAVDRLILPPRKV